MGVRKRMICLIMVVAGGLALPTLAYADCDVNGGPFFMHKNDTSSHNIITDAKGCELHFVTDKQTMFRSASIAAKPRHGRLSKVSALEFAYHPIPGFKGNDSFALRVCGSSPSGGGCSRLSYLATVN